MSDARGHGYHLMRDFTCFNWYATREEAERDAVQMNYRGGSRVTVEPSGPIATFTERDRWRLKMRKRAGK